MNQVYEIDEAELIDAFLETEYQKLLGLRTALLHADDRPLPLLDVQLRQIRVLSTCTYRTAHVTSLRCV